MAITKSASRLIRERGIDGTSVQDAMAGAGLTVGAFYAHFKNKDEMIEKAVHDAMTDAALLVGQSAEAESGVEALLAISRSYLSETHRDRPEIGCPLPPTLGASATKATTAKSRKMLAAAVRTFLERLKSVSNQEVGDDEVMAVLSILIGAQVIARATRGQEISSQTLASCDRFLARIGALLVPPGKVRTRPDLGFDQQG